MLLKGKDFVLNFYCIDLMLNLFVLGQKFTSKFCIIKGQNGLLMAIFHMSGLEC